MIQFSIAGNKGNSGGPAIDSTGKVVGLVIHKGLTIDRIAICVPSEQVTMELKGLLRK